MPSFKRSIRFLQPASLCMLGLCMLALGGCASVVGNMTAKLLTSKTADLGNASVQVRYIRNLYPAETQTTEVKYVKELWQPGKNAAVINFLKRRGIGMYEIDGTVSLNGEVLTHLANGVYAKILEADELDTQSFVVETSSGQRAAFDIEPTQAVGIVAVNGKKEGAEIDQTADLVLELDNPPGSEDTYLRLGLLADALGTRAFYELGVFRSADRLVVPAAAFRHSAPPNAKFFKFNTGANYLQVERFEVDPQRPSGVGAAQALSLAWDTVPVTLKNKVDVVERIEAKGKIESENGALTYSLNKPNAAYGRPFSSGKKFGVASLSVRGTLRAQVVNSWSTTSGNTKTTYTETKTWQFPQLPDAFWDQLLANMNDDITAMLKRRYGSNIVAIERVVQAPTYAEMEGIEDENTQVQVERSYKGSKNLIPTSVGALYKSISSTFASDRPDARLMRELGVDGLISVTLDLDIPTDTDKITLRPLLSIRVSGPPNGYLIGPTVYAEGLVSSPEGVAFSEEELQDINALNRIVRKDELMAALERALDELDAKEAELGYEAIWSLK